jgi:hypothetical protein
MEHLCPEEEIHQSDQSPIIPILMIPDTSNVQGVMTHHYLCVITQVMTQGMKAVLHAISDCNTIAGSYSYPTGKHSLQNIVLSSTEMELQEKQCISLLVCLEINR